MSGQTAAFNGGSDRNSARALQMQQSCAEATAALETAKGRASAAADEVAQLSAELQEATDQRTQLNNRLTAIQVWLSNAQLTAASASSMCQMRFIISFQLFFHPLLLVCLSPCTGHQFMELTAAFISMRRRIATYGQQPCP